MFECSCRLIERSRGLIRRNMERTHGLSFRAVVCKLILLYLQSHSASSKWCHDVTKSLRPGQSLIETQSATSVNSGMVDGCQWKLAFPAAYTLKVKVEQLILPHKIEYINMGGIYKNVVNGSLQICSEACHHYDSCDNIKSKNYQKTFHSNGLCLRYSSTVTAGFSISQSFAVSLNITVDSSICSKDAGQRVKLDQNHKCMEICRWDGTRYNTCSEPSSNVHHSLHHATETSSNVSPHFSHSPLSNMHSHSQTAMSTLFEPVTNIHEITVVKYRSTSTTTASTAGKLITPRIPTPTSLAASLSVLSFASKHPTKESTIGLETPTIHVSKTSFPSGYSFLNNGMTKTTYSSQTSTNQMMKPFPPSFSTTKENGIQVDPTISFGKSSVFAITSWTRKSPTSDVMSRTTRGRISSSYETIALPNSSTTRETSRKTRLSNASTSMARTTAEQVSTTFNIPKPSKSEPSRASPWQPTSFILTAVTTHSDEIHTPQTTEKSYTSTNEQEIVYVLIGAISVLVIVMIGGVILITICLKRKRHQYNADVVAKDGHMLMSDTEQYWRHNWSLGQSSGESFTSYGSRLTRQLSLPLPQVMSTGRRQMCRYATHPFHVQTHSAISHQDSVIEDDLIYDNVQHVANIPMANQSNNRNVFEADSNSVSGDSNVEAGRLPQDIVLEDLCDPLHSKPL